MKKRREIFLKLLNTYGAMTAPQLCKLMGIQKTSNYSTSYSDLIWYIGYPDEDGEFNQYITIKHYEGDEATSSKSEFSITEEGKNYLKKNSF